MITKEAAKVGKVVKVIADKAHVGRIGQIGTITETSDGIGLPMAMVEFKDGKKDPFCLVELEEVTDEELEEIQRKALMGFIRSISS